MLKGIGDILAMDFRPWREVWLSYNRKPAKNFMEKNDIYQIKII